MSPHNPFPLISNTPRKHSAVEDEIILFGIIQWECLISGRNPFPYIFPNPIGIPLLKIPEVLQRNQLAECIMIRQPETNCDNTVFWCILGMIPWSRPSHHSNDVTIRGVIRWFIWIKGTILRYSLEGTWKVLNQIIPKRWYSWIHRAQLFQWHSISSHDPSHWYSPIIN